VGTVNFYSSVVLESVHVRDSVTVLFYELSLAEWHNKCHEKWCVDVCYFVVKTKTYAD